MKLTIRVSLLVLFAAALTTVPAAAQSGFGLKGHLVYNSSTAEAVQDGAPVEAESFVGFNVGAEYVLPLGLGVGITGYTSGDPRDTDAATVFILLGEANYFISLPLIPVTPYVGAHIGLGTFSWDERDQRPEDQGDLNSADFGWQLGVRVQLMRNLALDAQYRRLSASAEGTQAAGFEANQVLIGVRLF